MLLLPRLYLKTALLYLLGGTLLGGWLLAGRAWWPQAQYPYAIIAIHTHLLLVGFMLQMVFGVAIWMFPRKAGSNAAKASREPLGWVSYGLLNAGMVLRAVAEPLAEIHGAPSAWLGVSAVLQVAAVLAFVLLMWGRIRSPAARGE